MIPSTFSHTATVLQTHGVAYSQEISRAARSQGLDPDLLAAVAAQETGGPDTNAGHNILGDGGHGHGIFQIDDRWHSFARSSAALNPQANANYAAHLLRSNLDRYGGDVHKALSAYNAGSPTATGTRTTWKDGQTLGYADSVLRHYAQLTHDDDRNTVADVGTLRSAAQNPAFIAPIALPQMMPAGPLPSPTTPAQPADPSGQSAAQTAASKPTDYSGVIDPEAA